MTMHSEAAPQSVHSSCCTNGTARLPVGKPRRLSAGKPSAICLLVAMGGESLRAAMAGAGNRVDQLGAGRRGGASFGQVLLERGQERDQERLGLELHFHVGVHAVVVV